jgi:hypothetical protein
VENRVNINNLFIELTIMDIWEKVELQTKHHTIIAIESGHWPIHVLPFLFLKMALSYS